MRDALIGHSGYVGSTLCLQHTFAAKFRAKDVHRLADAAFDTVYCAGAPGQKWLANADPGADADNLARLMDALSRARCQRVVLLSTVDVFARPWGVDEDSETHSEDAGGYGRNRRHLEQFVQQHFATTHVVRLPGLVGTGLRKNALYDLRHRRRLETLRPDARFQFYPMVRLWQDLQQVVHHDLRLCHLSAEPVQLGPLAKQAFGVELADVGEGAAPSYDVRSRHAHRWGAAGAYQVAGAEVFAAVSSYARETDDHGSVATLRSPEDASVPPRVQP